MKHTVGYLFAQILTYFYPTGHNYPVICYFNRIFCFTYFCWLVLRSHGHSKLTKLTEWRANQSSNVFFLFFVVVLLPFGIRLDSSCYNWKNKDEKCWIIVSLLSKIQGQIVFLIFTLKRIRYLEYGYKTKKTPRRPWKTSKMICLTKVCSVCKKAFSHPGVNPAKPLLI